MAKKKENKKYYCVCCSAELSESERTGITIMAKYIGYEGDKCMGYNKISSINELRPLCKVCIEKVYEEINDCVKRNRNIHNIL